VPGVLGIHFEGPHLSLPKKGTHSEQYIRPISEAEFAVYARQDLGIKMITLAPENVSVEDIKRLVGYGVKVCLGHTNADFETTQAALQAGADGFTHLFNAMSAFTSREPGVVGAALWDNNSWCGLIVDGHHVHPNAAKLAIRTKAQGKMLLVTDAMPPVGTDLTEFDFFDGRKVIRTGDRLNSSTGELAGSVLDMASAVRNTVNTLDVSLAESLRMASLYPAQYLGLSHAKGRIAVDYDADFVLLDINQYALQTFIAGQLV
jgi:N-acetylglucosamine-6-phosphate deacetylase